MNRWSLLGDGFKGLWRWLRRRPLGENEFAYHHRSQVIAFLVLLVFTLPVEILLVELLVRSDLVRWILLLGAVVGTLWAIGVILSIRTFPHRLVGDELAFRYGALGAAVVPVHQIVSVERSQATPPRGEGVFVDLATETGWIAAGGQTAVMLRLREPITVWDGWIYWDRCGTTNRCSRSVGRSIHGSRESTCGHRCGRPSRQPGPRARLRCCLSLHRSTPKR